MADHTKQLVDDNLKLELIIFTLKYESFQTGNDSCRLRGSFFTPSVFNDFRERGDFFDINLFTDEGSMPAHKVILSACSDFFRDKLRLMQPSWLVFISMC